MNEERAREGVEHLQAAAVELISALRAFLDIAEDVVRHPDAATGLLAAFVESVRPPAEPARADGPPSAPRVTRIRVS